MAETLSSDLRQKMYAYRRTAKYLSAGPISVEANSILDAPLYLGLGGGIVANFFLERAYLDESLGTTLDLVFVRKFLRLKEFHS